uniref:Secreted protein n=1 Tax=Leersia perrieri TaxID=77586 RepID=A0A0D9VDM9_9ORYZ
MRVAGFRVRVQAILVMSLLLLQVPFLPCTLATGGTRGKSLELLIMVRSETHHKKHLDLFATRKSTRSRRILHDNWSGPGHDPPCC